MTGRVAGLGLAPGRSPVSASPDQDVYGTPACAGGSPGTRHGLRDPRGLRAVLPERVCAGLARPRLSAPSHPTGAAGVLVLTARAGTFLRHPRGVPEGGSSLPFS